MHFCLDHPVAPLCLQDVDSQSIGIIPRALQELVDYATNTDGLVQLRASYVEIYNENVLDLLAPLGGAIVGDMPSSAEMREQAKDLFLPTVTETPFGSVREAMEVMRLGNKNRHQAETKMNRNSSRSHAVFIVTVLNRVDQSRQKFGQLYLVDLAGSERVTKTGVAGTQLSEAKSINKSLLALGQVIFALAHKLKHVPYRDSKLTHLLRNCLGGNARTAVLITVSPHADNAGETLSSLRFGARASLVENAASENVAENVQELKRLLERARQDLAELRASNHRLQAEISAYKAAPIGCPSPGDGQNGQQFAKRIVVWELLPSLVCPLTHGIMRDPVLASDGWSYERRAIEKHIAKAGRAMPLSPVTGQRLSTRLFTPNLLVKQLVRQYLPDLGPLEEPLPVIQLLHVWHVQLILSFLDFRSLARCEAVWPSFRAIAEDQVWAQLLQRDFPNSDLDPHMARSTYREEALKAGIHKTPASGGMKKADGAWRGLRLFQPKGNTA
ncbi:KLP1 [Symbiodinium natans]|uniref:Kinesin-like protein n=1 Tax=Symbiodinium natans TaxID=878477 RepID=A0A812KWF1_9DINO|nr:KLP1 [Symbiodinium natans]